MLHEVKNLGANILVLACLATPAEIQMPLTKTELDGVFADIDKDGGGDVRTAVVAALLREAPL